METEAVVTNAEPEQPGTPNYVRAFCGQTVKAANPAEREILHLITTAAVDRAGDVVEPTGAQIENFMRNPVVMADHSYSISTVIGKAMKVYTDDSGMWARTKFRDTPLAQDAYRLSAEGLGGWSIGFRPTEYHTVREGAKAECQSCAKRWAKLAEGKTPGDYVPGQWSMHFMKWELLEYSSVAIPMNQEIVNDAIKRGLVTPENVPAFFIRSASEPSVADVSKRSPAPVPAAFVPAVQREIRKAHMRLALLKLAGDFNSAAEILENA